MLVVHFVNSSEEERDGQDAKDAKSNAEGAFSASLALGGFTSGFLPSNVFE
jgi:hypothetical protein